MPDRISSVIQLFVRPIAPGKAGKPVEFGAKLDIRVVDGWTRLECCSQERDLLRGKGKGLKRRFDSELNHLTLFHA